VAPSIVAAVTTRGSEVEIEVELIMAGEDRIDRDCH
jgi:hypothetical protein